MLKFYRSGRFHTLGDLSPFIHKLDTYLRMAHIPHEEEVRPFKELIAMAPHNMVPFIEYNGRQISDSDDIIDLLETTFDDPLNDKRLSTAQHMQGHLINALCQGELFRIMVFGRWLDGDYPPVADFINADVPEEHLPAARAKTLELLTQTQRSCGLGRFGAEYNRRELQRHLDCLAFYLGDAPFLFGDAPSRYDASMYGAIAAIIHFPIDNPQVRIARSYDSLRAFCDRVHARYFDGQTFVHAA